MSLTRVVDSLSPISHSFSWLCPVHSSFLKEASPLCLFKGLAREDPNCDGFLVILTPQAMTDPTACAEALSRYASVEGKPVLASWMGGQDVAQGLKVLNDSGIPCYAYPDMACRTFNYMQLGLLELKVFFWGERNRIIMSDIWRYIYLGTFYIES